MKRRFFGPWMLALLAMPLFAILTAPAPPSRPPDLFPLVSEIRVYELTANDRTGKRPWLNPAYALRIRKI